MGLSADSIREQTDDIQLGTEGCLVVWFYDPDGNLIEVRTPA